MQIVVCAGEEVHRARYLEPDKRKGDEGQRDWACPWWYVDAGAALMLLLLAVVDEGLQGAFVGARDPGALARTLGIPLRARSPSGWCWWATGAPDKPSPLAAPGASPPSPRCSTGSAGSPGAPRDAG